MELTPLRYFRTIAQLGHMTRAAKALGVSQPALSAMLKKLESEVGAALLDRTGRGVALTEAGRVFLGHAEDAIRRADAGVQAVRELTGLEKGSIRIGAGATATSYLLPPVVSAVRRRHPGLTFYVREAGSNAVAAAVLSGELDLGIVTQPMAHPEAGELLVQALVDDELRLIVPPGHALHARARGKSGTFSWRDLAGESVVAFEAGTAVRDMVDRASHKANVGLHVVMELRSIESIKQMVAAGIGVGFVSRFALDEPDHNGKNPGARSTDGQGLACREGRLSRELVLIRRRDRMPSSAVAEFERELIVQTRRR